jgi:hypothetical protein
MAGNLLFFEYFKNRVQVDEGTSSAVIQQKVAREFYQLHLSLIDSCPDYMFTVFPFHAHKVIDLEQKLTNHEVDSLNLIVKDMVDRTKVKIACATIESYKPFDNIDDFAGEAVEIWETFAVENRKFCFC